MAPRPGTVVWSESARDDLNAIAEYIAAESPGAAAAVVRELLEAASSLAGLSLRGRPTPEVADANTRELLVASYRLIYRVQGNTVQILAVVHQRRQPGSWRR